MLAALPVVCGAVLMAQSAQAQVGGGTWVSYSPSFNVQQKGCGHVSGLTFSLSCSDSSGEQRAERRYVTHGGGTWQFEGVFKLTSLGGTRISVKQTFRDSPSAGPYFLLAVEHSGRLYAVEGGATIGSGATVGTSVRVNTVHQVGSSHKCYINGSLRHSVSSPSGNFYDKFGFYRTSSGHGPGTIVWSGIKFWHR
jgi:hypothetical protein